MPTPHLHQPLALTSLSSLTSGTIIFQDDFEFDRGWRRNARGNDTAITGHWEIGNPETTYYSITTLQLDTTPSGNQALVTGASSGRCTGDHDVDGGITSMRSPEITLSANADFQLELSYTFGHLENATADDFLQVIVIGAQGNQIILDQRGSAVRRSADWTDFSADLSAFAGQTIRLDIAASDSLQPSLIEAAIDDIVIRQMPPDTTAPSPDLDVRPLTTPDQRTHSFQVTYSDDRGVDVGTISTGDIRVTGPNGYDQVASFVSLANNSSNTAHTATYRIAAPNSGVWTGADNGLYNIFLEANQVSDLAGNSNANTVSLGDFDVDLPSEVLPLGDLAAGVAVSDDAAGSGYLMHSRELLGTRFLGSPPAVGNASNLIAVQYDNGQWFYNDNYILHAFVPREDDVLLAELDFDQDSATLLAGTRQTIYGIDAGYVSGDLAVEANLFAGNVNIGEFGVSGTQVNLFTSDGAVPGQFSFNLNPTSVDEANRTVTVTVNRFGGSDGSVSVDYATVDVSATAGRDYVSQSGTLSFADGVTQATVTLEILDDAVGEGQEAFGIRLENPTGNASLGVASTVVIINESDGGTVISNPGDALPDLRPIVGTASDYVIDKTAIPGRTLLRLSAEIANTGDGPLELWGNSTQATTQPVFQRIYNADSTTRDVLAGEFVNHPSHGHFHFEGFATYNLRAMNLDGAPGEIVASGGKTSFCLLNVRQPFAQLTDAAVVADGRGGDHCGFIQGIDVGYSDVYLWNLPDQWIDVTSVPDGEYLLEITTDPDNRIIESSETNNTDYLQITLDKSR